VCRPKADGGRRCSAHSDFSRVRATGRAQYAIRVSRAALNAVPKVKELPQPDVSAEGTGPPLTIADATRARRVHPALVAQIKKQRPAMEKAAAVRAVAGRALVDAENALEAAHADGGDVDGASIALGAAEVADQAARKKGDAVAGRLGYLSLEQWSATIAAAHREYPGL
jgi:hypothetical protein